MPLSLEELKSKKEEIDLEIRKRDQKLFTINDEIRRANIKKSHLEYDTAETQEGLASVKDDLGEFGAILNKSKVDAKKIISEAKQIIKSANEEFKKAKELVFQRVKDLRALDRDKGIAARVKAQFRENISKNKELDTELKAVVDKGKDLDDLIAKQKDVDSLKKVLEAQKEELEETISANIQGGKDVNDASEQLAQTRVELKSEISRYSQSFKEMEASKKLLEEATAEKEREINELESQRNSDKERNNSAIAEIESRSDALTQKQKKVDIIIEKMKKNKKLHNDLKEVGLLRW